MIALVMAEMRRDLARRAVWVLILIALGGILTAGVVAWSTADDALKDADHPALLANLWDDVDGEGILILAATFLPIGALMAGATVLGAEWRAGTIGTLLTWEPRRGRVYGAKMTGVVVLSFLISAALLALFCLSFLPAAGAGGSTAGTDGDWLRGVVGAALRIAFVATATAAMGAAIASIGKNTVAALAVAFGWMAVAESIVRGFRPRLQSWLMGDNIARWVTARPLEGANWDHSTLAAGALIGFYAVVTVLVGYAFFRNRDVLV